MSTRATIVCDDETHFFDDLAAVDFIDADEQDRYLRLPDKCFEKDDDGTTTVRIPAHVWLVIRETYGVSTEAADYTDERILSIVESYVDQRLEDWRTAKGGKKAWAEMRGSFDYGLASEPREAQICNGVERLQRLREAHRGIRDRATNLKVRR
jgi:hypothetical protein